MEPQCYLQPTHSCKLVYPSPKYWLLYMTMVLMLFLLVRMQGKKRHGVTFLRCAGHGLAKLQKSVLNIFRKSEPTSTKLKAKQQQIVTAAQSKLTQDGTVGSTGSAGGIKRWDQSGTGLKSHYLPEWRGFGPSTLVNRLHKYTKIPVEALQAAASQESGGWKCKSKFKLLHKENTTSS